MASRDSAKCLTLYLKDKDAFVSERDKALSQFYKVRGEFLSAGDILLIALKELNSTLEKESKNGR